MIIGNGMIAKSFRAFDSHSILIFASGVSNSKQIDLIQCAREKNLLSSMIKNHKDKLIIYFSSCSIDNIVLSQDEYHQHKINMEKLISKNAREFLILRLPNIIGPASNNSTTLLSFLAKSINEGTRINIWSGSVRNLIDISDVVLITKYIIKHKLYLNQIISIANPTNISIFDLVEVVSNYFEKKLNYNLIETNMEYLKIDNEKIKNIINILNIKFDNYYIENAMKKYYLKGSQ